MLSGIRCSLTIIALTLLAHGSSLFAGSSPEITWRTNKTVDAKIDGCPLDKLLARVATLSGWKVFVEPGLDQSISVQFKNVPQGEALKLFLGNLNYALVPQKTGSPKLLVYRNSIGDATNPVAPEGKPKNWLANEIILTVSPDSKTDVEKLAKELGGKIVAKSDGLNAYRLQFDSAEAAQSAREKLSQTEGLGLQDNYAFDRPADSASGSPSLASMFPIDPKPVADGKQITVALVDTPIQPLEGKMKDFILPSIHVTDAPSSLPNDPTHATSMAETLLNSMALVRDVSSSDSASSSNLGSVRILPVDIYGNSPTTTTFEVAQGLYKAMQANPNVINLSLGGTGDSPMVEYLLQMAKEKNILVLASAGNSPTTDPTWPAASPYVLAVTAATYNGDLASYANRGDFVDLKAPGTSRISYNGLTYISTGTSTATAFMSGQAAALRANGLNSSQTADLLLKNWNVNLPPVRVKP